jgi:hypothetical protein
MSSEQCVNSLRFTREEGNLIRVHSFYRGSHIGFCFGIITDLNENVIAFRSEGEGGEIKLSLHNLALQTGIFGYEPHRSWRLVDTDGWSWTVFDVEYSYNKQRELLLGGSPQ